MALEQYSKIADTSVDEDSPLDETLMKDGIRDNQEGLRNLIAQGVSWFNWFGGDGSDGSVTEVGNGTRALAGGKQYTTYSDGGFTIELTGTNGYQLIGATTSVSITGTVEANGNGCAGGAGGDLTGEDGFAGTAGWNAFGGTGGGGGSADGGGNGNGGTGGASMGVSGGAGGASAGANGTAGTAARTDHPRWYGVPETNGPGAGGGGGGADGGANDGAAGGAGGGCIVIEADAVTLGASSNIQANGADGGASGASRGAGGGGAGGSILVLCRTLTDSGVTTSVTGGAGGTGGGTGGDGGAGGAGRVKIVEVL